MTASASTARQGDGRLWAIAFGLSLLLNAGLLGTVGFMSLKSEIFRKSRPRAAAPAETARTLTILPELSAATPAVSPTVVEEPAPPPVAKPKFARTSEDQVSAAEPETRAF
ncbi:MAG: hypothetical protein EOP87_20970, partial [Verrucomicrobiaceae bacterium]